MTSSLLSVALSGLQAAQAGLATVGHNIANVNTPGFSRQQTVQENRPGAFFGGGYLGRGVDVATVVRRYDGLLVTQARTAQAAASHYAAAWTQATAIDNLLADPSMGLSPALSEFFAGVNGVAANPSDTAARQAMLGAAQSLATRLQLLDGALAGRQRTIDHGLDVAVAAINTLAQQIADLNQRIGRESAAGQAPNDLLDRRDAMMGELAKLAGVTTATQSDGSLNVFLSNGQAIVVGGSSVALATGADAFDPTRRAVGLATSGGFVEFPPETLFGGELGGLLAARRDVLDPAQNALGRLAIAFGDSFNAQHRLGQDLNGTAGTDLFTVAIPRVAAATYNTGSAQLAAAFSDTSALTGSDYEVNFGAAGWSVRRLSDGNTWSFATLPATVDGITITAASGSPAAGDTFRIRPTREGAAAFGVAIADPARIAAASPVRSSASVANTGTGTIGAASLTAADPNQAQPVTITFTAAGTFDVSGAGTGNPSGLAYTRGMTLSYNGWQVRLDGQPAAGDTFAIGPNAGGVGDNGNAVALAALQSEAIVGGTASVGEAYAALVARVGSSTHEADVAARAQEAIAAEADKAVQQVSGVNLDEEAANLLKYQQAYQAAGKVIQTAASLFETLLSIADA